MSESNEQLVRRIVEAVWNQGNLAVVDATFARDYIEHNPRPGQEAGIDGYKGG